MVLHYQRRAEGKRDIGPSLSEKSRRAEECWFYRVPEESRGILVLEYQRRAEEQRGIGPSLPEESRRSRGILTFTT